MRIRFVLFSILIISLAVCNSLASAVTHRVSAVPFQPVIPGVGSYFVIVNARMDSTKRVVSADTSTATISKTGMSIYGKTNVVEIISIKARLPKDTSYMHYEPNGDVSFHLTKRMGLFGTLADWMTYPFASQGTIILVADSTMMGRAVHDSSAFLGAGIGSITIKGRSFSEQRIRESTTFTMTGMGASTMEETISFAPSLGAIVESDRPGSRETTSGEMGESFHLFVTDYVLK